MSDRFQRIRPPGDEHERLTCTECGFIAYENPKIIAGAVVEVEGGVLLCRRAIEPRAGFWTLPAGYMELGETVEEAAAREAWEEAQARIQPEGILAIYSIARIGQVQVLFRARLAEPGWAAGPESLEVRVFAWEDIPWEEIAFPSARWALHEWHRTRGQPLGVPAMNPPEDPRGMRPLPNAGL
ncbi:NUDIX hydrolase [Pseudoroseomonas ludipueritiae]|uniref:NUDIX hydrolase n=1 Tax=Pseudoroseomonas ludipueritiae TaxID=198093 RepID=A0ABR7RCB6_9PROT|nr:NUDIX hydrolase [Pseudoroseomonas ludipueritiae]MBC9179398.1 NUDIX hydrolase [Pseudoroseomonas ludipueritiae]